MDYDNYEVVEKTDDEVVLRRTDGTAGRARVAKEQYEEDREVSTEEPEEDEEEGEYVCDVCGDTFDSEQGLSVHAGQQH